eukprot:scaffold145645_cov32-Tisochrysis_lutea.AAC.6
MHRRRARVALWPRVVWHLALPRLSSGSFARRHSAARQRWRGARRRSASRCNQVGFSASLYFCCREAAVATNLQGETSTLGRGATRATCGASAESRPIERSFKRGAIGMRGVDTARRGVVLQLVASAKDQTAFLAITLLTVISMSAFTMVRLLFSAP